MKMEFLHLNLDTFVSTKKNNNINQIYKNLYTYIFIKNKITLNTQNKKFNYLIFNKKQTNTKLMIFKFLKCPIKQTLMSNQFFYTTRLYHFIKNIYFLSDTRFNCFWFNNLLVFSLYFYRVYFMFYNLKSFLCLTSFSINLFNRFKKTRKKILTFLEPEKLEVGVRSEFMMFITNLYNKHSMYTKIYKKNNKNYRFLYNYWFYLRNFFTPKLTIKNKNKFVTNLIFILFLPIQYSVIKLNSNSTITSYANSIDSFVFFPIFFPNFFFTSALVLKTVSFKKFISRRRKIRRFIFKNLREDHKSFKNYRSTIIRNRNIIFTYQKLFNYLIFVKFFICVVNFGAIETLSKLKTFKLHRFNFKPSWKLSKKKKKNLRKRFFSFKRFKRHRIHRFLKNFRFKKNLFYIKTSINSKVIFITNYNKSLLFISSFLNTFSTKLSFLLVLLTSTKFRRFLPKITSFNKLLFNFKYVNYFSNYLTMFKKWSNVIPFFYLPKQIKTLITYKKSKLTHYDYLLYLRQIIGGFLESLIQKKIFFKISTKLKMTRFVQRILLFLYKKHRSYQNSIGRGFFFNEMLFVCWYAMFTKDLQFLMSWVSRAMGRMEIRKHRKFIKILKALFTKYKIFFLKINKIKGVKFDVRGKLGVKGNAKKRHLSFSVNTTSFSKKKYRLDYKQGLVYTETGVLGLTLILTY